MGVAPKQKVSREMVLDAAFEIARGEGAEGISARAVARKLDCSTQPVLYHFATIEDLKSAVYEKADACHTAYILQGRDGCAASMLEIGLSYIRFGAMEPNLFRFLFQSNRFSDRKLSDLTGDPALEPVMQALSRDMEMDRRQARSVFTAVFLLAHGMASMLANNAMEYDEAQTACLLRGAMRGMIHAFFEEGVSDEAAEE